MQHSKNNFLPPPSPYEKSLAFSGNDIQDKVYGLSFLNQISTSWCNKHHPFVVMVSTGHRKHAVYWYE